MILIDCFVHEILQIPMESSRIDSGTDVSSDGEREKTKLMMAWGIQPLGLDIRYPSPHHVTT